MIRCNPYLLAMVAILAHTPATAATATQSDVQTTSPEPAAQVHGFIAQSVVFSDRYNFYGNSTHGSTRYRVMGLTANATLSDNVTVSGSLQSRLVGPSENGDVKVNHALLNVALYKEAYSSVGIQLGRVKSPLGLYADTWDIPSLRPGILLPQSLYNDKDSADIINGDGGLVYGEMTDEAGNYTRVSFTYAKPIDVNNINSKIFYLGPFDGDLKYTKPIEGIRILHVRNNGQTTYALWVSHGDMRFDRAPTDAITSGNIAADTYWLSFRHDAGKWVASAEAALNRTTYTHFNPVSLAPRTQAGWYVELGYRPSSAWELFTRYDWSTANLADKKGEHMASVYGTKSYSYWATDTVVGARYHINEDASVAAEFHSFYGTANLTYLGNPNYFALPTPNWNALIVQFAYRF